MLGSGKIALTFGDHGNVTGVEQSSSAALNGAGAAATSIVEGAHAGYDAVLKARIDELELEIKAAKENAALRSTQSFDTSTYQSMTRTRSAIPLLVATLVVAAFATPTRCVRAGRRRARPPRRRPGERCFAPRTSSSRARASASTMR